MIVNKDDLESLMGGLESATNALEHVAAGNKVDLRAALRTVREALILARALHSLS